MSNTTLYELLEIPEDRADMIAKLVRKLFYESSNSEEVVHKLIEHFNICPENREIFASGWYAGRYAGIAEVFATVQEELEKMAENYPPYPPSVGYV